MRRGGPSKLAWVAVLLLVVGGIFGAMFLFPRQGRLVVDVRGPSDKVIDTVQVFVDGTKQSCDTSPCVVDGLESRSHFVKVSATGYATPETQEVEISGGGEKRLKLQLAAAAGSTGLKVTAGEGTGLRLWLDGKEMGPLPQELKDVAPGEHSIRVAGNDRFQAYEEKVTLNADETKVMGPLALKVVRGLAVIEAGQNAEEAKVWLVSGSERRPLPELPIKIDINTDKSYRISATKKGFQNLDIPITFEPGNAQKRFAIDLRREGEGSEATSAAELAPATPRPNPGGGRARTNPTPVVAQPAAVSDKGKLNVSSNPPSNAILDGRPLGPTPRSGISVTPGAHTVVFVHPQHGRKQVSVNVAAGKTANASVRFP
jgi:hypothetical protein